MFDCSANYQYINCSSLSCSNELTCMCVQAALKLYESPRAMLDVEDTKDASLWYAPLYVASSFQAAFVVAAYDITFYIKIEHGVSLIKPLW